MIRPINRDPLILARPSLPADASDRQVISDLMDTLRANLDHCVGMAANMIGENKRIIVFLNGPVLMAMVNPRILRREGPYEAEEGCLSLPGARKARRWQKIVVEYLDASFHKRTAAFEGFPAQIIQHEMDHCDGILI